MNKYERWYFSIINKAKERTKSDTYEKHHIVPKCLKGTNDPSNLVKLTPKEHFVCHVLLTRMTTGMDRAKMFYSLKAFSMKKIKSRFIEQYRNAYKNEEWNEYRKQRIRDALASPERRETKRRVAIEALNRPTVKKKLSEISKKQWETRPRVLTNEAKIKISESTVKAMADKEIRERYLIAYQASQSNRTQKIKDAWQDPIKKQIRLERIRVTIAKKQIVEHSSLL